jgi:Leucine-rich repeat (LRR) protein
MVYNALFSEGFFWDMDIGFDKREKTNDYAIRYGVYKKKKTMKIYTDGIFPKIPSDISMLSIDCLDNVVDIPPLPDNITILQIESNDFTKFDTSKLPINLKEIDFSVCMKLKNMPDLSHLKKLKGISFDSCEKISKFNIKHFPEKVEVFRVNIAPFKKFPKPLPNSIKMIYLRNVPIKYLPDLHYLPNLEVLSLVNIPVTWCSKVLQSEKLDIEWRPNLKTMRYLPMSYYVKRAR